MKINKTAQFTHKDVTHFRVCQRKIGEGGHGVVHSAEIKFSNGRKKWVAAKRYKSAIEAAGDLARVTIDTLDSRPALVAQNVFFRLKVGDPRSEGKVQEWRTMIQGLRASGCAIAKMDFVPYEGEYWLVSPAFERQGKSIVGEDYDKTNPEERKLVWRDLARMVNAGYYSRNIRDTYFFYPTRYGKKPIIIDLDQIQAMDKRRRPSFYEIINQMISEPKEKQIPLVWIFYSQLTPRNRKAFLRRVPDEYFEALTGRKMRFLSTDQEIEIYERNLEKRQKRKGKQGV